MTDPAVYQHWLQHFVAAQSIQIHSLDTSGAPPLHERMQGLTVPEVSQKAKDEASRRSCLLQEAHSKTRQHSESRPQSILN